MTTTGALHVLLALVSSPATQDIGGLPTSGGPVIAPPDLTSRFDVPPGTSVKLWAESPKLYNPTAIDVDQLGRVWVAEGVNYRKWGGRNPGREHAGGERIVILSDEEGNALASKAQVFVTDPDLVVPLGICVYGSRVFVSCSPNLYVYKDDDLDGVSDSRATFLTGFGGHDHDHGLHSVVVGPDMSLWFNAGNAGPHLVRDAAGWNLRSGSLYRDGGAENADNRPGLVSDDGHVWTGGLVMRVDANGRGLQVRAHNFRNNYELALDSYGNVFQSDNDDDGNQGCRALWCMEGGNHGYFAADGSRTWWSDRRPGQDTWTAHWHQDDPGVVPAGARLGAGGPTGVALYESEVLGHELDGRLLCADAGAGKVYALRPKAVGAGIEFEPGVLIAAKADSPEKERAGWFRPSDVAVGPDGTIFVSDWSDPGVGGHAAGDREAYGRILRIVPTGQWVYPARIELSHGTGRMDALSNPAPSVRALAARAIAGERDASVETRLRAAMTGGDQRLAARATWIAARFERLVGDVTRIALAHDAPDLRITAVRALRAAGVDVLQHAGKLAVDPSPAVRRELSLALRGVPLERSGPHLLALARGYDGADRAYLEAFGLAAEGHEAALWPGLAAALGDADPARWSASFAGLAWRLHPEAAVPGLAARARATALALPERRRAIDALAFVRARAAGEAMVDLAVSGPEDTRELARWWVLDRHDNDWKEYDLARQIGGDEKGVLVWSSGIVRKGSVDVDVDVTGAKKLWLVGTEGRDGQSSDWIAWLEPRVVHAGGVLQLASAPWKRADAAWGETRRGKNCTGGPIVVDGKTWEEGIGSHAYSVTEFELPAGATRFSAKAAVDDSGSKQGRSDVEFQVLLDEGVLQARVRGLAQRLAEPDASAAAIEAAAEALCETGEGGLEAIRLAKGGKLTPAATAAVARHIFRSPDLSVRALASAHFERATPSGSPLPSVAELARMEGSAARGADLFFGKATCGQCHAFHGRGADIGPDLTTVRQKYAPEALLDAMLNPSSGIAFGYDTWLVETKDEELFTGFVIRDDESELVLRDTTGRRHAIPKDEIAARARQSVSAMPDGVALGLAPVEIADVLALLRGDPKAPGVPGERVVLFDGTDLSQWTFHLADPAKRMEDVWSVKDGVLRCSGSPAGYLKTKAKYANFVLELDWRFDATKGAGNSGVLLRRSGEDKVWPRSIEAQLMSRNAGDIWNIGEVPMVVDADRTQGRRTQKLLPCNEKPLGEWNHYKITLDGGELTLEVNGEVQNRASWCEEIAGEICLQSEGAWIEFRNVVLTPLGRP